MAVPSEQGGCPRWVESVPPLCALLSEAYSFSMDVALDSVTPLSGFETPFPSPL